MTKVLTALIAGHRTDRLAESNVGTPSFDQLRAVIQALMAACQANEAGLRLLAGVADGTDAEAAKIATENSLPLHLLAPGQPTLLSPDLVRAERQVWLGAEDADFDNDEPYAVRDEIALGFADLLIVVWDGNVPRGLTGGTVRLVFQAALAMKPVIWIDTEGTVRLLDRTLLTVPRRHQLQCPHPNTAWLLDCFAAPTVIQAFGSTMKLMVEGILHHPDDKDVSPMPGPEATSRAGHLHNAMMAISRGDVSAALRVFPAHVPQSYRGPAWDDSSGLIGATPALDEVFDTADIDATIAAGHHRDATWIVYASSSAAVFSSVAGAIYLWPGGHGPMWAIMELVLVVGVVALVRLAVNRDWHGVWVGQRFVAEQLRYARMGLPLLTLPQSVHQPAWNASAEGQDRPGLRLESQELRIIQRTVSSCGLPTSPDTNTFIATAPGLVAVLGDYVRRVIDDQIGYHQRNHHRQHAAHHSLHGLSMLLFALTGAAVIAHFLLHGAWLLIFTAFLPALAAGIHGLATKLEIARVAAQSAIAEEKLTQLRAAIGMVEDAHGSSWRKWLQLRKLALDAARVMSDENTQWQQLVSHQEPELPA